nr:MAG TPA: hypothetical protein [Caudoviricetes sp.]
MNRKMKYAVYLENGEPLAPRILDEIPVYPESRSADEIAHRIGVDSRIVIRMLRRFGSCYLFAECETAGGALVYCYASETAKQRTLQEAAERE